MSDPARPEASSHQAAGEEFRNAYSHYERLTEKLAILFEELLEKSGIDHAPLEARVKSVDGFVEKLSRKGDSYPDPLRDMPDLIGIRVVVYYLADRRVVRSMLEEEFVIDWARSVSSASVADPDRFGYESDHYVVSLRDDRASLTDWQSYRDLHAEIQVRTVLQHAWAAISHKLDYKSEIEVPRNLRRQLFRLSALMELADEEFQDLRENTQQLEERYAIEVQEGHLEADLDGSSLDTYLEVTDVHLELRDIAEAAGFDSWPGSDTSLDSYHRSVTLHVLTSAGVKKLEDLDSLMRELKPQAKDIFSELVAGTRQRGYTPHADPVDMVAMLVLGSGKVDERTVRSVPLTRELGLAMREVAARRGALSL